MRRLTVLGATGSIGASTLDLVRSNRQAFEVVALTANTQANELATLAREFRVQVAVVADESCLAQLRDGLAGSGIEAAAGAEALIEAAARPVDLTIAAIVGCCGLTPTMAAIEQGATVALANKEALVSAGDVMTAAVARRGATLLPIDSEHNAIFQCLAGNRLGDVRTITLTASGGPFREWPAERLAQATPAEAVRHPNWDMGAKISVDSATMMNKGLELIEAHHLFPVGLEQLRILIHPQSVVHSMVEFRDGSIASALAWPERMTTSCAPLDLAAIGQLSFAAPDETRFPATRLARDAVAAGGAMPAILNAANEVAVAAFLAGQIRFTRIAAYVEDVLACTVLPAPTDLAGVIAVDAEARAIARQLMEPA
jgi:1-deoxy-D-xylulose-5-phosphate reductoisomerase